MREDFIITPVDRDYVACMLLGLEEYMNEILGKDVDDFET